MDLSGPDNSLLLRLMSAATLRARVLAANLTNQNTPGFKRQDVRFEEQLTKELARQNPDLDSIQAKVVVDETAPARADGNTVNMESEVSSMHENRLMYELYASILAGQTRILEASIRGDN